MKRAGESNTQSAMEGKPGIPKCENRFGCLNEENVEYTLQQVEED